MPDISRNIRFSLIKTVCMVLSIAAVCLPFQADAGLGLPETFVSETVQSADDFTVAASGTAAPVWYDAGDHAGVYIAVTNLQADIQRVTSVLPALSTAGTSSPPSAAPIIVGTVGNSALIDSLIASGKLDDSDLAAKWDSFVIETVSEPFAGVDRALVIAGSNKRGTIYGIYELSEQLGVSPWYWWADVPAKTKTAAYVAAGRYASGEPAVKYRGIFLNDEAPALTGWSNATFGGRNSAFYEKVYELILRLRGNYLWPAMWGDAFNLDDPMNPVLADRYGVVMGTSHHEPMMRNQQEWSRNKSSYGNDWDYLTNSNGLQQFWTDGINNTKSYENIVTIGMRGDGDEPMVPGGDMAANVALLEQIVDDQRAILTNETGKAVEEIPQIWALYKEVMDYYDYGMRVPDDVTLLWADDNWGNIRRLPTDAERTRSGGAGVYYHFDYVGGPRSYKWLNTNPLPKIHEQMSLAYAYGADRIWIVNVGDLKPMEVPMEFFLRMAWDPERWSADELDDYLVEWAAREFGDVHAVEAADLMAEYARYNGRRKPELLEPDTFSVLNDHEADRILADWLDLEARAETLYAQLPADTRDAFYQLVQFSIKACANLNNLYITTAYNRLYASQQRASANALKAEAEALFQADADLTTHWNSTFAAGKWIHMMDQTHIGYTSWNSPADNVIPSLSTYSAPSSAKVGVAIEGSEYVMASVASATLPLLSSEGGAVSRYIDVFRQGTLSASYTIEANHPWVQVSNASGSLADDVRAEVSIDWSRAPTGRGDVLLTVTGSDASVRTVLLPVRKAAPAPVEAPVGFLDLEGYVAIEAPNFDRAIETNGISWTVLPGYGRTLGGVTPYPLMTDSIDNPRAETPRLEYDVYLNKAGTVGVNLIVAPSLNFNPDSGLRCAVAFDDQVPVIIDIGGAADTGDWADSVRDAVRTRSVFLEIDDPGAHILKVWMVDPGFVLQRVEIDTGGLPETYLGPQESPRGQRGDSALYEEEDDEAQRDAVVVQAESGTVGADFSIVAGAPSFITVNGTSTAAPTDARSASYTVTFTEPETYRLFARIRVGSGSYDDDSMFLRSGFGGSASWISLNGLAGVGFMNSGDTVYPAPDNGSTGSQVWKWVDLSSLGSITFAVSSNALTQTFEIGGREDGLDIDKLVFGLEGDVFTVGSLDMGYGMLTVESSELTLEAESSSYGGDFTLTGGTPSYISIGTTVIAPPFTSARGARFQAGFAAAGSYRLYARVRVGSGSYDDDSLFLGNGFGAKDPAVSGDWITINGLANAGYSESTDPVDPADNGSAGTQVWKWIDLSSLSGLGEFVVSEGALSRTLDIAGREDGFDIDKLFFGPANTVYTVEELDAGQGGTVVAGGEISPILTVDASDRKQEIDGFGASSAWVVQNISDEHADLFFSTSTNSIGLSLLRLRITPDGTTWETTTARKAIARGAKVWATPWSPPGEWKSNGVVTNGGTLLAEYHDDWAQRLSDFVVTMNNAGVPLEAISAQNEPNFTAVWESCRWTPEELRDFIGDYLGPALAANGLPTRVLAGEPVGWNQLDDYGDAILADSAARAYTTHIATHDYSGTPFVYTAPADNGKRLWETEFTDHGGADSDLTMASGLRVANEMHDALTIAEVNAWHYWWLSHANNTVGALMENGVLAKRGWVMGNWSRFVRPGYRRVATYGSTDTLRVTAFTSTNDTRLVIVAVNSGDEDLTVPVAVEDCTVTTLIPFETSGTRSLESLAALPSAADGSFSLAVPAGSVVSFVWDTDSEPPSPAVASFETAPEAVSTSRIAMTAVTGTDDSGPVEYYFTCVSGGGNDSGWQTSPTYIDEGLLPATICSYTVTMRDRSILQNTGTPSAAHSVATFAAAGEYQESGGVVSMEAENGTIGSRWITGSDPGASGGAYIEVDPQYDTNAVPGTTAAYLATYAFDINTAGNYRFWFRMYSGGAADDSFFWRIDNGGWDTENNREGIGTWYARDNSRVDNLGAGRHVLEIAYRENGTRLDKFIIQLDGLADPAGDGAGENSRTGTGNYITWTAPLPAGLRRETDDSNGDGVANLMAYALGYAANDVLSANPAGLSIAGVDGFLDVFFLLPAPAPEDVRYQVEYSEDLLSAWSILSTREGNGAWAGAVIPIETGAGPQTEVSFDAGAQSNAFYRLKISTVPAD